VLVRHLVPGQIFIVRKRYFYFSQENIFFTYFLLREFSKLSYSVNLLTGHCLSAKSKNKTHHLRDLKNWIFDALILSSRYPFACEKKLGLTPSSGENCWSMAQWWRHIGNRWTKRLAYPSSAQHWPDVGKPTIDQLILGRTVAINWRTIDWSVNCWPNSGVKLANHWLFS